jgi:hypothetical protein
MPGPAQGGISVVLNYGEPGLPPNCRQTGMNGTTITVHTVGKKQLDFRCIFSLLQGWSHPVGAVHRQHGIMTPRLLGPLRSGRTRRTSAELFIDFFLLAGTNFVAVAPAATTVVQPPLEHSAMATPAASIFVQDHIGHTCITLNHQRATFP